MQWRKLGLLFQPDSKYEWMRTHAANPVAEHVGENLFRIYFSPRDENNRACVAFFETDMTQPFNILRVADQPLIAPGKTGGFDDSGVSMACVVNVNHKKYFYYLGWNLSVTVPWRNSIGLAISEDQADTAIRYSDAPIVDRSCYDPFSLSYPWVIREKKRWQMWYGSNLSWGKKPEDMTHVIKYAESEDGINWIREGVIAIDIQSPDEYAFSKPCVIRDGDIYRMWYSYRGRAYRIGYAESRDGIHWKRLDHLVGIDVSASGWDSETVEYACVFDHYGQRFMVYNGNGYGKSGIGLAVLEQD